ncbi:phosphoglycerate dehydrogenase [Terricaulis silvestris]|uniref:D-3-phosphoglycerate dehydrogenase n=1 Tax=Terricaulis silvestris TaxID=2686094 RepID=A0A6I6MHF4_9CAUL|nr:phosphoglycerate dehydrogenase [Terricaulis silvestris]QGZ94315.1 D-3-phosphoglycerate dehydrogenase [Terricaulis silvestris]
MPKVLISDELSDAAVNIFKTRGIEVDFQPQLGPDAAKLKEIIGNYDGLAIRSATKVKADIIAAAKNLKVIGRAGIGVDNVDIPAATAKGIVVMNTPFGNSITTAEHAIALMFAAARQVPEANLSTQAGKWEKNRFMGRELYAKTLGLIGCGNIGGIVADRALGLKMKVVAYDPFLSAERAVQIGVEKVELEELLARADMISLHVPLTDKTKNVLSRENLAKTKRGVIIVNAARGGLVDEQALREALESEQVAAAAFDVFTIEPAKENVLFGAPNFIATPHLGASTNEAQENVALQVAEQMSDYLLTGAVTNALNMASITAEEAPRLKPFAALAEKLGAFAGQIADEGLEEVEIEYEGDVTKLNMKPLTASALAGILRPLLQDVNVVSAPALLKERGVPLTESTRDASPIYDSLIRIKVKTGGKWRTLGGTVVAGAPKIAEVKGMQLEAPFHPAMLFINNSDKPGFIGALGTLLGEAGVNIATFHLGREDVGADAIALVGIDQAPSDSVLTAIKNLPQVRYAKLLRF